MTQETSHPHLREAVAVIDFGSQYSQLIARRVRELNVYCELIAWDASLAQWQALNPRGFILSGGPASVYEANAPSLSKQILQTGLPILGICYGMQTLTDALGGQVAPATQREYGPAQISVTRESALFRNLPAQLDVWMSHGDRIEQAPNGFHALAVSANSPVAAIGDETRHLYGLQFHPEVAHTPQGKQLLRNFLYEICGCQGLWTPGEVIGESIQAIRAQIGEGRVVCGLSGGVDSAVAAALIQRAIGERLICVFVDHGFLRQGEAEQVMQTFAHEQGLRVIGINAREEFLTDLAGISDPEEKRRRIGNRFVRIFEAQARRLQAQGHIEFLAQGTLYPDVIESAGGHGNRVGSAAAKIKTHHNVGGLPADLALKLVEPLRSLFKDEVRTVGETLGLPAEIVWRHPFPGPGLAIRVLGEVTWERLETLRAADAIFLDELRQTGLYRQVAQAFVVLLPVRSVGVMGDGRTYANVAALRAVTSDDFMTADWARLPYELLGRTANRIVNEVPGVNRVVFDVSSKPPATIEWE